MCTKILAFMHWYTIGVGRQHCLKPTLQIGTTKALDNVNGLELIVTYQHLAPFQVWNHVYWSSTYSRIFCL